MENIKIKLNRGAIKESKKDEKKTRKSTQLSLRVRRSLAVRAKKTKKKKEKFLKRLEKNFGLITKTCSDIRIDPSTYYKWYKKDKSFKEKVDKIDNQFEMIVEDKIKQGIIRNDGNMIRFYANRRMEKYIPRVGIGQAEGLQPLRMMITTVKKDKKQKDEKI